MSNHEFPPAMDTVCDRCGSIIHNEILSKREVRSTHIGPCERPPSGVSRVKAAVRKGMRRG